MISCLKKFGLLSLVILTIIRSFYLDHHLNNRFLFPSSSKKYSGKIHQIEKQNETRVKLILCEIQDADQNNWEVCIQVIIQHYPKHLKPGDELEFSKLIQSIIAYRNPGVFDYQKFLFRKNIYGKVFLDANKDQLKIIKKNDNFINQKISFYKNKIREYFKNHSSTNSGVLFSLLWGDRSLIEKDQQKNLQRLGLSHLMVISGFHLILLFGLFYFTSKIIISRFSKIFLFYPKQKIIQITSWILTFNYYLLCESTPSIHRAFLGLTIVVLIKLLDQKISLIRSLLFAVVVILIIHPYDLFHPGFQLSVMAVLIIGSYYLEIDRNIFNKITIGKKNKFLIISKFIFNYLARIVLIYLLITISITPILLYHFKEFQILGLITNLIFIPMMEFFILPLMIISIPISVIYFNLSKIIWDIIILSYNFIYQSTFSLLKEYLHPHYFYPPSIVELTIFYLFLWFGFYFKKFFHRIILLVLFLSLLTLNYFYYFYDFHLSKNLELTHLDVGQGDAIFLKLSNQKKILIDTGGNYYFDVGKNILFPYFFHQRIKQIDILIITHSDRDHYLGLKSLLELIPIKEIWWNGYIHSENDEFIKLLNLAKRKNIKIVKDFPTHRINLSEDIYFQFFKANPNQQFVSDNLNSLVFQLIDHQHRLLFTGDIEKENEDFLVEKYQHQLKSNYLKIPHHGSRSSSSEKFIQYVQPAVASLSAKEKNHFGHPHLEVIERYQSLGVELLRTDLQGAIKIIFVDDDYQIKK